MFCKNKPLWKTAQHPNWAAGEIFITYDFLRYKAQEIYACRITEADILAGKLVDKTSRLQLLVNKGETEFKKK